MEDKTVTVKFEGQVEQVDVNTFTRILLDYAAVARAAGNETSPDLGVRVNIRATRPGCLEAILTLVPDEIGAIWKLMGNNAGQLEVITTVAFGIYGIARQSGHHGKIISTEAKENGEIEITCKDGAKKSFPQKALDAIKHTPTALEAIKGSFQTLDDDSSISGIKMLENDEIRFKADRNEFGAIANAPTYEDEDIRHRLVNDVSLVVVRPLFEKSTTKVWGFVWNGINISARIKDESFLESLQNESFSMGDTLVVNLDLTQKKEETTGIFINKSYDIIKVTNHYSKQNHEQSELF
ncbi:MAG: hypothetical protein LKJ31_06310 [Atopobiaceae bacterium]|nr:hypothetical protein [Atopobiaceae bacterium]